jgi:ribosomal protein L20
LFCPGFRSVASRLNAAQRDRRLGYNVFYNMVYDLGHDPNIKIVTDGFTKDYAAPFLVLTELVKALC